MRRFAAFVCLLLVSALADAGNFGSYLGRIVVTWNDDGRSMTLVEPFAYLDPKGVRWEAPAGTKIDGASIPQFAWSIIGGPFEGKYRAPSIIHDFACVERKSDWQDVHLMFHNGMLASGVDPRVALIMYAAVYHFGPRWPREVVASLKTAASDEATALASNITAMQRRNEQPGEVVKTLATRGPGTKVVVVQFKPEPPRLSRLDFEVLKTAIARQNLTIEDVENFRGVAPR